MPVEFVTIEAEEIRQVHLRRTFEEAAEEAAGRAREKEAKGIAAEAVAVKRRYKVIGDKNDDPVRVILTVETKEEIGVVRRFKPS